MVVGWGESKNIAQRAIMGKRQEYPCPVKADLSLFPICHRWTVLESTMKLSYQEKQIEAQRNLSGFDSLL